MEIKKYIELLLKLNDNSIGDIISVLNQSVYVKDFKSPDGDSFIVLTGFSFVTHKGTIIELYYDFKTETVIRQGRREDSILPQISGLFMEKVSEGHFINRYYKRMLQGLSENGEVVVCTFKDFERDQKSQRLISIDIADDDSDTKELVESITIKFADSSVKELPLNRKLDTPIFYDGNRFRVYVSPSEYNMDEEEYEDDYCEDDYDRSHGRYAGSWAQDVEGLSDDFIDDVLDGEPDAYWNID